jgi:hypothetical protein
VFHDTAVSLALQSAGDATIRKLPFFEFTQP